MGKALHRIPGSRLEPLSGADTLPPKPSTGHVTLHLRARAPGDDFDRVLADVLDGRCAPLSRKEFSKRFGASRGDIDRVRSWCEHHRFSVTMVSVSRRIVRLQGPGAKLARAFGVDRVRYRLDDTTWNSYVGSLYVPEELAGIVIGVFGFDDRPDIRRNREHESLEESEAQAEAPPLGYTAPEVARMYDLPDDLDGRGEAVGVIALGGGYFESDMAAYFDALDIPRPKIRDVSIQGMTNDPTGPTHEYDGEVTGDVQTVAALVPKARITVYFAPNTAGGFFEAVATAVHDARTANTVLSISWGNPEPSWRRGMIHAFDRVLQEAVVLGVTVCCSSGDWGAMAEPGDTVPHVNFPGSSPHVLACGGTTLRGRCCRIGSEVVWHNETGASGGGVSEVFERPAWQAGHRVPRTREGFEGRGIPDVAANGDPKTGYRILGRGRWVVGAGTSASAPFWAGLIARINQARGRPLGLPAPALYDRYDALRAEGALTSITKGDNGTWRARKGWDCCTGLGTPRGRPLRDALIDAD